MKRWLIIIFALTIQQKQQNIAVLFIDYIKIKKAIGNTMDVKIGIHTRLISLIRTGRRN